MGGINSATIKPTFSFDDLMSKVNGTYNRGELKLNEKGGLSSINNHVWMQAFNNEKTSAQENKSVREAVYKALADKFAGKDGINESLKTAQDFLLGNDNVVKPLRRDEVRAIIDQLSTASLEFGSRRTNLSESDFSLLLKTIRAVKDGSSEVTKLADGSFKLNDASRSFPAEMVLSGLKTGSRQSILHTATVNKLSKEGQAVSDQISAERGRIHQEFSKSMKGTVGDLWDKLSDAFVGTGTDYRQQAVKTSEVVLRILREISDKELPGFYDSLDLDIKGFEKDVKEYLDDTTRPGVRRDNKGSYRVILELAMKRLDTLKANDTIEFRNARESIRQAFHDLLYKNKWAIEGTHEQFVKPTKTESEVKVSEYIDSHEDQSQAKTLVEAFKELRPNFELDKATTDLVEKFDKGTLTIDAFANAFVDSVREQSNYPMRGPDHYACESALEAIKSGAFKMSKAPDMYDFMMSNSAYMYSGATGE
ncbi:MAG: hypothetical protein MJ109_00840 [Kiritimatiellae bacterium]|nr:hypothetical protein [Kiritimatiellia bacterium]